VDGRRWLLPDEDEDGEKKDTQVVFGFTVEERRQRSVTSQ